MGIYFNSILISLAIIAVAWIGLYTFTNFGKKVLAKMQEQGDMFAEFMSHAKKDSEDIREIIFRQQGQIDKNAEKLDDYTKIVNNLHKRHVGQDH